MSITIKTDTSVSDVFIRIAFIVVLLLVINSANAIAQNLENMTAARSGEFSLHEIYDSFIPDLIKVRFYHGGKADLVSSWIP